MTKQPLSVRNSLVKLKRGGIVLPNERNPHQCWLLVVMHPMDNRKGEVFITHAANFKKFESRKGFEVVAHSFDKETIQTAQRKLTLRLGEAYQPKFSAHAQPRGPVSEPRAPDEDFSPMPEQPEDLLDFVSDDSDPQS